MSETFCMQVIFPQANKKDFDELTVELKEGLSPHFVTYFSEVFKLALEYDGPIVMKQKDAPPAPSTESNSTGSCLVY